MASSDLYEMRFEWPHREPKTVIVTGTFDHWSCSTRLIKTDSGFVGSVNVPWAEKIKYKFIVDGQWLTQAGQPTEMDPGGYINNIYLTPPKPLAAAPEPIKLNSYGFASVQTESVEATQEKEESPVPAPEPEKPVEVVEESPAPKVEEEKVVAKSGTIEKRISMPIVPVNAVEHNTIHSTPPPPPIPDYVLPPSPRARSTSPPPARRAKPIEAQESPVPAPEKPVEVVPETPTPKAEEKPVEKSRASERRMSIPIIPVNAVEHNTIHSTPPPPPIPDYVLPPPPRARSASPPPVQEIKQAAAVLSPEPEPAKLHEVEVEGNPEEPIIPIAPEVPIEEQKQEAIAHIPVDDLDIKPEFEEEAKKEEEQVVVVPTPEAAKVEAPKTEEVKPAPAKEEDKTTLPTPPATPHSKKEFPLSSPSATPTGSPSSSRFGTAASKKKRRSSFFGKIKELFHSDKDKEKEKVKK
ncbi:hypothetical protein MD484_g5391, partial [Candolleomyces efflorescens]